MKLNLTFPPFNGEGAIARCGQEVLGVGPGVIPVGFSPKARVVLGQHTMTKRRAPHS